MTTYFLFFLGKSDLHFIISSDGLGGAPLTEGGFAYLRASSKATWGVKSGSYYFECKVCNGPNTCTVLSLHNLSSF